MEQVQLIDAHAHIDDEKFDADREAVVRRAQAAGLIAMVNVGCDLATSNRSIALAQSHQMIYAAVGIHPQEAQVAPADYLDRLRELAGHRKVVAIGEIGLDYYYETSPREVQMRVFREQLVLARELNLPFVIHDRDAHGDVMAVLREMQDFPAGGILHCFSGSWEMAELCLKMGLYISLAGPVTFNNAGKLKEIAARVPLDRLLVETDCPYLTPVPHRGKRNEPAYVRHVAERIAALREMALTDLARATVANTCRIYGLEGKINE